MSAAEKQVIRQPWLPGFGVCRVLAELYQFEREL